MVKSFLAVGAACLFALAVCDTAFSQSKLTVHGHNAIPLPANVMTNDDWLDPGQQVQVGSENNYARMVEAPADVQVGPDLDQNW